jgi:hypothetical protein
MPADRSAESPTRGRWPRLTTLRVGAACGTLGALALLAPLLWQAALGGVAALALAALGLGGAAVVLALPLSLQKLENRLLAARRGEARANPISQLQNDVLRREERLRSFRQALVAIGAQIESMAQMIDARRRTDPDHVLDRQQRALERMTQFHALNLQRLRTAQDALDAFRHQVQQKVFEWEFYVAGKQVMQVLNPRELGDLVNNLLTDEALRTVQQRFNEVFAELDVDLRAPDAPTRSLLERDALSVLDDLSLPGPVRRSAR